MQALAQHVSSLVSCPVISQVPAGGAVSNLGPWTLSRYTLEFEEVGKLGESNDGHLHTEDNSTT